MRKILKRVLPFCLVIAIFAGMATVASAAETIKINGYEFYDPDKEPQVSISNVIGKDDTKYLEWADTYICQTPVVVTALVDLAMFGVATLIPMDNTYIEAQELDIDGDVIYYDGTIEKYDSSKHFFDLSFEYRQGSTVAITEPGLYHVYGRFPAIDGGVDVVLVVKEGDADVSESGTEAENEPETETENSTINALPTSSTVLVNGTAVEFEAYNIEGSNYFKLRDIAKVLTGTEKQFEVTWDESIRAINLISGETYTEVGGELTKGDGSEKEALKSNVTIYKDGAEVSLTAYNIDGSNYFRLRDLGKAFDFGVFWDEENNAVIIDTSMGYTEE